MSPSDRPSEIEQAYDHLDDVETQIPASLPHSPEQLEELRSRVEEYEQAESEADRSELLDRIDQEIDDLRESIEQEVEQGAEAAHDALESVEERIQKLRERVH